MSNDAGDGRRARLAEARLYLVIEGTVGGHPADGVVAAAIQGGVDVVQLREKTASDSALERAGRRLRSVCDAHGALLVVNDRPDVALRCGADGLHLGQDDEPLEQVRERVGPELLIGLSTHDPDQVDAAGETSADYLGVGPVYPTATKPGLTPVGEELVRHAASHARQPFFAIGGIDAERAPLVAAAGATRIAVVRAIRDAPDPRAAAAALRRALDHVVAR